MDSLMVTQRWRQRTRIEVMFNAVPGGNLTSIEIPPVNVTAPNISRDMVASILFCDG